MEKSVLMKTEMKCKNVRKGKLNGNKKHNNMDKMEHKNSISMKSF